MATSRTGTTEHLKFRRKVLNRDRAAGITHCPICACELDYKISKQPHSAEPDHIIPTSKGGTNHPNNGRTICRRCNQKRGNKTGDPEVRKAPRQVTSSPIW